jgi:hypothetical protein
LELRTSNVLQSELLIKHCEVGAIDDSSDASPVRNMGENLQVGRALALQRDFAEQEIVWKALEFLDEVMPAERLPLLIAFWQS